MSSGPPSRDPGFGHALCGRAPRSPWGFPASDVALQRHILAVGTGLGSCGVSGLCPLGSTASSLIMPPQPRSPLWFQKYAGAALFPACSYLLPLLWRLHLPLQPQLRRLLLQEAFPEVLCGPRCPWLPCILFVGYWHWPNAQWVLPTCSPGSLSRSCAQLASPR